MHEDEGIDTEMHVLRLSIQIMAQFTSRHFESARPLHLPAASTNTDAGH